MVSPVLYERHYDGAFLVSEAPGQLSRDAGVVANAGTIDVLMESGLVVVQNAYGTPVATPGTGDVATYTSGTLGTGAGCQVGTYALTTTGTASMQVIAPDGRELAPLTIGASYSDEIKVKVTASGTVTVGDTISIAVPAGNLQWSAFNANYVAGPLGILCNGGYVPASGTKKVAVVTRNAEVNAAELVWDNSIGAAGSITGAAGSANVGNATIGSLTIESAGTLTGGVEPVIPSGIYTATATDPYTWVVEDPTGAELGIANTGTAYAGAEIGFTITAGSTLSAEGDVFNITVSELNQTSALALLAAAGIVAR